MARKATVPTIELRFKGRRLSEPAPKRVGTPLEAYAVLKRELARNPQEELWIICVDAQNLMVGKRMITRGSLNTVRTMPREIFTPAILAGSLAIILAHNHPSGSLEPSRDDLDFTSATAKAGELLGIQVMDHLIISSRGFTSMKERGIL